MSVRFLALVLLFFSGIVKPSELDDRLSRIIEIYGLQPVLCNDNFLHKHDRRLVKVGEKLFKSKSLSGDGDTSCSTCHLDEKQLTDGLRVSVGVGGEGEGAERLDSSGVLVARNAFTLRGRGHNEFSTFFWDGKVQQGQDTIASPFGEASSLGYFSPLSVAATLPIVARDEFLGRHKVLGEAENLSRVNSQFFKEKFYAASALVREKIKGKGTSELNEINDLFFEAGIDADNLTLADIGNAISSFIAVELSCVSTPWEEYLRGNHKALSPDQKRGAILFYGAARCASCHDGPLTSDFEFHSIASPQGSVGPDALSQDLGRASVTYKSDDKYLFRTPPLIRVSETPPYGHSGQFNSLEEVIIHHLNPYPFFNRYGWSSEQEMYQYGRVLMQRDRLLFYIDVNNPNQVDLLESFLHAL